MGWNNIPKEGWLQGRSGGGGGGGGGSRGLGGIRNGFMPHIMGYKFVTYLCP